MDFYMQPAWPLDLHLNGSGKLQFLSVLIHLLMPYLGGNPKKGRFRKILAGRAQHFVGLWRDVWRALCGTGARRKTQAAGEKRYHCNHGFRMSEDSPVKQPTLRPEPSTLGCFPEQIRRRFLMDSDGCPSA